MLFRSAANVALLGAAAQAILIPPHAGAVDGLGDDKAIETLAINPFKRTITLDCAGCKAAERHGDELSWKPEAGTSFLLDFEIGQGEESLTIDGVQLYPPSFSQLSEPFYVRQAADDADADPLRLLVTGYTFHFSNAETVNEAGNELLPMTFRITSVESQPVDPPALTIYLLKDASGRLMLASFKTTTAADASPKAQQDKECEAWPRLCKWKALLQDKVDGMKASQHRPACHKGAQHGAKPHDFHHHHHGHGAHRFHRAFRRAFFTVLLPIFVGVVAGTLTYVIGMTLGYIAAVTLARTRCRAYTRVAQNDAADNLEGHVADGDKYSDMPEYDGEAPPVYEAAEKEVVGEPK